MKGVQKVQRQKLEVPQKVTSYASSLEVLYEEPQQNVKGSFKRKFPHLQRIIEKNERRQHLPLVENLKKKCPTLDQNSRDKTVYNQVIKEILDEETIAKQKVFKGDYTYNPPSQKDFDETQAKLKQLSRKLEIEKKIQESASDLAKHDHTSSVFFKFSQYRDHSEYELIQEKDNLEESLKILDKIYKQE